MKTVVYADVLVVINIIVNYFLLRASAAVISFDFKAWRFLVSSVLGGTFSLIIFVDGLPAALLAAVKLLFLLLMVLAAFGYGSFKRFFKCCAAFLASNLAFAGLMLAGRTFLFPDSRRRGLLRGDRHYFTGGEESHAAAERLLHTPDQGRQKR